MKKHILIPFIVAAFALLGIPAAPLVLSGCAGHPTTITANGNPDHIVAGVTTDITSNVTAGVNGTYDPGTGGWTAGIVVTFKTTPPAYAVADLMAAGAIISKSAGDMIWTIPHAEPLNALQQKAIASCLSVPGTTITTPADMNRFVAFALNRVDAYAPDYGGWDGPLSGTGGDAAGTAMAAAQAGATATAFIADYVGDRTSYGSVQPSAVLIGAATRAAFRGVFAEIAQSAPGDVWTIWYSGHGSQVVYPLETIEGLCLFDGILTDRELWQLFMQVPAGVRLLFAADACHAGGFPGSRALGSFNRAKSCPIRFRGVGLPQPDVRSQIGGEVIVWAGCGKDQFSMDGAHNGLFTATALAQLTPDIDLVGWANRVRARMPAVQQPELLCYGTQRFAAWAGKRAFT